MDNLNPQEIHLRNPKSCPNKPSHLYLQLMRRIDELHLEYPFAGSRMLRDMLRREGQQIGRKHVRTLMKKMGRSWLRRR